MAFFLGKGVNGRLTSYIFLNENYCILPVAIFYQHCHWYHTFVLFIITISHDYIISSFRSQDDSCYTFKNVLKFKLKKDSENKPAPSI